MDVRPIATSPNRRQVVWPCGTQVWEVVAKSDWGEILDSSPDNWTKVDEKSSFLDNVSRLVQVTGHDGEVQLPGQVWARCPENWTSCPEYWTSTGLMSAASILALYFLGGG